MIKAKNLYDVNIEKPFVRVIYKYNPGDDAYIAKLIKHIPTDDGKYYIDKKYQAEFNKKFGSLKDDDDDFRVSETELQAQSWTELERIVINEIESFFAKLKESERKYNDVMSLKPDDCYYIIE